MDLGIKGRRAIVCASSKGLGRACAMALANEGVHVTLTARGAEALKKTADEIRKANPGVTVTEVAGDITTPAGREAALKACPDPDILINNAGGPPPGDFRNWTRDDWIKAIDANMLTPIELIKATVDGMMARKFGRIVNITSAAVKAPIEILGLSNGARAGLTGFVAGLSRKTVIANVTINSLLPGPFDTDRLRGTAKAKRKSAASASNRSCRNAPSSIPPAASAPPRNSATPAPSCAARRPASSPARTSCSTAARSRARCEGGLVRADGASARGAGHGEMPTPTAGPGEVRVRLEASGVIRPMSAAAAAAIARWNIRASIPNSDGAGIIDQVGDGVTRLSSASASGCSTASVTAARSAPRPNTSRSLNIW